MRVLIVVLCFAAVTQATSWANLRPLHRVMHVKRGVPQYDRRIIGGENAVEGQFKYQVAIQIEGSGFCGGSLIYENYVLTAGHCVKGANLWTVTGGALNFLNLNEPGRVTVGTQNATLHENYNGLVINNDIAVIRLPAGFTGPNIAPVRLPSASTASDDLVGQTARVSGWGKSSDASITINPDLKFVDLTVITNEECETYYGSLVINANKLCVGTNGGIVSTCNGDSGGPLVITESDGEPTEVGIVSFGSSLGCESGYPAAFTRVANYIDWIATNTGYPVRP
ncbi:brachyurin-like [Cloeon dipterum]|uniref:brachyurin-like n=1 Tax=Cloeon dipterum TaxID=197152 RepID=UPI00322048B4